jgi:nitrogen regulatory protein P-II 1
MKLVVAVIKPHMLEAVKDALLALGVHGITVTEVQGFGRQRGHTEVYRGAEYKIDFVPKIRLDIVVDDDAAVVTFETVMNAARTDKIGDGKVWVVPIEQLGRIRTGEMGSDAL